MGKRICKELFAEKQILFSAMILMLIVQYALNILQKSAHLYEDCIMDSFVWVSDSMQGTSYLIVMAAAIIEIKDSYKPDRISRSKSLNYMGQHKQLLLFCDRKNPGKCKLRICDFYIFSFFFAGFLDFCADSFINCMVL